MAIDIAGWADTGHTKYNGYESSPAYDGAHYTTNVPYPYWPGYGTFTPLSLQQLRVACRRSRRRRNRGWCRPMPRSGRSGRQLLRRGSDPRGGDGGVPTVWPS